MSLAHWHNCTVRFYFSWWITWNTTNYIHQPQLGSKYYSAITLPFLSFILMTCQNVHPKPSPEPSILSLYIVLRKKGVRHWEHKLSKHPFQWYLTNEETKNANKCVRACIIRKNSKRMNISREDRGKGKLKQTRAEIRKEGIKIKVIELRNLCYALCCDGKTLEGCTQQSNIIWCVSFV